jgi:hypothetical protein
MVVSRLIVTSHERWHAEEPDHLVDQRLDWVHDSRRRLTNAIRSLSTTRRQRRAMLAHVVEEESSQDSQLIAYR